MSLGRAAEPFPNAIAHNPSMAIGVPLPRRNCPAFSSTSSLSILLLPRKSGFQAIPKYLSASPESRILVVSSQTGPTSVRQAISAGAHGYVPKRATDTEVIDAIRRIAAGERYVDPDLGAQLVVADGVPALEPLSDRERDVLHLLELGHTNQEIGKQLFISVRTVDTHRTHIMRKLHLDTRAELVLFALANGLIGAT